MKNEPHSESLDRSRCSLTSKVNPQCANQGRPLSFVLTRGQVSNRKTADSLMRPLNPEPRWPIIPSRKGRSSSQKHRLAALQEPQQHRADVQQA